MDIHIWSIAYPDYDERMKRMGNPAAVSMAKRAANQLTLIPLE